MSTPKHFKRISLLALGLSIVGLHLAALTNAASAQSDPLDESKERTSDPFSGTQSDTNSTFFDMMHRAQLGTIRSVSQYGQDQQDNIGTQAKDFRARQMQLMQQGGQSPTQTAPLTPLEPVQPTTNQSGGISGN
jgi:hypothetical protein